MNWYQGNIAEAVAKSKSKNAIFVVYVAGKDELTQKLTNFINEEVIKTKLESDDFVAIKIESDTQAYMQFAKIYQVVPVPSIFFIGNAGTPLEISTGIIDSVVELEQKINKVLETSGKCNSNAGSSSGSLIATEQFSSQGSEQPVNSATPMLVEAKSTNEVTSEEDVSTTRLELPNTNNTVESKSTETPKGDDVETDSHLAEARKLLEQKRKERIELEKKEEKERELRRRREGKEMQTLQSWQKEQELKELKENIRRERLEEQAARERIRAQIAGDRAERAQKFSVKSDVVTTAEPINTSQPSISNSEQSRIQFRISTGESKTHTFNYEDQLGIVRQYVKAELLPGTGIRDFILATTYPKREFSGEDDSCTLKELGLYPSAVILVIGKESSSNPAAIIARSGGMVNIISSLFWVILSPVFAVFGYLKSIGGGSRRNGTDGSVEKNGAKKRSNEAQNAQSDAAKRRNLDRFLNNPSTSKDTNSSQAPSSSTRSNSPDKESKPYRRYIGGSNIHRLTDKRKDSDDENATWNGNSTQQQ